MNFHAYIDNTAVFFHELRRWAIMGIIGSLILLIALFVSYYETLWFFKALFQADINSFKIAGQYCRFYFVIGIMVTLSLFIANLTLVLGIHLGQIYWSYLEWNNK